MSFDCCILTRAISTLRSLVELEEMTTMALLRALFSIQRDPNHSEGGGAL